MLILRMDAKHGTYMHRTKKYHNQLKFKGGDENLKLIDYLFRRKKETEKAASPPDTGKGADRSSFMPRWLRGDYTLRIAN